MKHYLGLVIIFYLLFKSNVARASTNGPNYLQGLDISHWQGNIEWNKVAQTEIKFVFAKATQATTYRDPKFQYNWRNMKLYNFTCGAYHFFSGDVDYVAQSKNFVSSLRGVDFDSAIDHAILDVEVSNTDDPATFTDNLFNLLQEVECSLGTKPIIYTYNSFWNNKVLYNKYDFTQYKLWIAHWTSAPEPTLPGNWTDWYVWQYTDQGHVDGITENVVDLNRAKLLSAE